MDVTKQTNLWGYSYHTVGCTIIITAFLIAFLCSGCTTQSFDPPDKVDTVFRVKIENVSNGEIEFEPEVSFYYVGGEEENIPADGTIAPGEEHLIIESKKGAYGASIDIQIIPRSGTLKLILEQGTGTGDNFEFEKIAATRESHFIVFLRYGEWY